MLANPKLAAAALIAALLAACVASSSRQSTAEALTGILAGDWRSEENRARDVSVPEAAIRRMTERWEVPTLVEAHDVVLAVS